MMRVVVVEDSDSMQAVWCDMLSKIKGMQVVGIFSQASTAQAAVDELRPDLVLLDIELGADSGSQVLRHAVTASPETQVVIVTNHADKVFRKHYLNAGAHAFFDKTHEFTKLRGMLVNLAEAAAVKRGRLAMSSGNHA